MKVAHQESSSTKVYSSDGGTQCNGDHCLLRAEDWSRWISVATHHFTGSKQLFHIGIFLVVLRVLNFRGRFEALNDAFLASFIRRKMIVEAHSMKINRWRYDFSISTFYSLAGPFQRSLERPKRRSYAKVMPPGSWVTNLPIRGK